MAQAIQRSCLDERIRSFLSEDEKVTYDNEIGALFEDYVLPLAPLRVSHSYTASLICASIASSDSYASQMRAQCANLALRVVSWWDPDWVKRVQSEINLALASPREIEPRDEEIEHVQAMKESALMELEDCLSEEQRMQEKSAIAAEKEREFAEQLAMSAEDCSQSDRDFSSFARSCQSFKEEAAALAQDLGVNSGSILEELQEIERLHQELGI